MCVIIPFHRRVVLKALTENVFKTLSLFPAGNNSDPDVPLFGVVVGGLGGVVLLSVMVTVLSIYCCKRRPSKYNVVYTTCSILHVTMSTTKLCKYLVEKLLNSSLCKFPH